MKEIDLSLLNPPDAVEPFDFETIFLRKKQALIALCPEAIRDVIAATLELESEPLTIDLQQQAYSELLMRQRINEAVLATFLATAKNSDLDHIGASRGLNRKLIQAADKNVYPPKEQILESDSDFRSRIQAHPEKYAVAGPRAAYRAHALDVVGVADANPVTPIAGTVRVYIKSYQNNGIATSRLIEEVQAYLSSETRRPLCDLVEVHAASAKIIHIEYETEYESALAKATVQAEQDANLQRVLAKNGQIAGSLALSKIIGALDVMGAKKVRLIQPTSDIQCRENEFIQIGCIIGREMTHE